MKNIVIIGSGLGSLTTAALLAKNGFKVTVIEQNWMPGGCTGTYWRKGYWFESGATTLVGLSEGMPLHHLLEKLDIKIPATQLQLPMQVFLPNGTLVNRHQNLEQWILEAERIFGKQGQAEFWRTCYKISQLVWDTSLKQQSFPPQNFSDLLGMIKGFIPKQVIAIPYAFKSTYELLKNYNLHTNPNFLAFVDEQLVITAQNSAKEVNALFGATALCYTNYPNYYLEGGMQTLINTLVNFIIEKGGTVQYRTGVNAIKSTDNGVEITTKLGKTYFDAVISGIPLNNLAEMLSEPLSKKLSGNLLKSDQLTSAFSMGIGLKCKPNKEALHNQIILEKPIPGLKSKSIFVSFHPDADYSRADNPSHACLNVSTHVFDPAQNIIHHKKEIEIAILELLVSKGFFSLDDVLYCHSTTPGGWEKWTARKFGFVGGYPQYMATKPWQMMGARLLKRKIYLVGDSVYPGQGIPGVVLSGLIAYNKMLKDLS